MSVSQTQKAISELVTTSFLRSFAVSVSNVTMIYLFLRNSLGKYTRNFRFTCCIKVRDLYSSEFYGEIKIPKGGLISEGILTLDTLPTKSAKSLP